MQRDSDRDDLERLWLLPSADPANDHRPGRRGRAYPGWLARRRHELRHAAARKLGLALVAVLLAQIVSHELIRSGGQLDLVSNLPSDGVVAADVGSPSQGHGWLVTSGTLLTRGGVLTSGIPDAGPPDPASGRTGSAVLRAVSARSDLQDVTVHLSFRVDRMVTTPRTPAEGWDGLHVFLRYVSPAQLYVVDLHRRDGTVTVKRKNPSPLGTAQEYQTLDTATVTTAPGVWHSAEVSIWNQETAVVLVLTIDGLERMRVYDTSGQQLRSPGRVGLRGDNAQFDVRRMVVEPAQRTDPPAVDPSQP